MRALKRCFQTAAVLSVAIVMMGVSNCSEERRHSVQLMNEGIALAQARRVPEALEKLEEAGSVDPTHDAVFFNQAMLQLELQQPARAKAALELAIEANGERANYHEKLGTVMLQMEPPEVEGAKSAFERAVQLEPTLYKAHFKLAQVLERLGQEQAALERYTVAIQRGPRFAPAYQELGRLYSDLGLFPQAIQVLRSGITSALPGTEDQAGLHHMLGVVYQQQRNYDRAIESFKAALQVQPGRPDTLFSLGWTYGLIENREEAVRYLQKFMEAATPETPATYTQAARERIAQLGGN
jgi:tetratricopeptide (TPR) repeat protein